MKILICGKGGSGKSTVSALIAKSLASRGYDVLVIDGDESNLSLYRLLGVEQPKEFIERFGGRKRVKSEMKKSKLFEKPLELEEIRDYVSEKGKIKFLTIGKIREFGDGCACPIGTLLRGVLKSLKFDGFVIVDTDAGVEHFGRAVAEGCDLIFYIIDPTFESIALIKRVEDMAKKAGKDVFFILNKVDDNIKELMLKQIDTSRLLAVIPMRKEIFESCLKGEELDVIPEIEDVAEFLVTQAQ